MRTWLSNFFYSFPIQLLVLSLRQNLLLLINWIALSALISGSVATKLGINFLFVSPEYMGKVNWLSFMIVGAAFGIFMMTWNLANYLLDAYHFPFLASLQKPFTKFCTNNFIIPLLFLIFYIVTIVNFHMINEDSQPQRILLNILGFFGGLLLSVLAYGAYFALTNKDIVNYLKKRKGAPPNLLGGRGPGRQSIAIERIHAGELKWKVRYFITESLKLRPVRSVAHYDSSLLLTVFKQNHKNAIAAFLFATVILVSFGFLVEIPYFRIPAGAIIFILFIIGMAIIGAIVFWFKKWAITAFIAILLLVNVLTSMNILGYQNKAYGLKYDTPTNPEYTYDALLKNCTEEAKEEDRRETIEILENWKAKFNLPPDKKPKMVFLCVSGGGLKSAVWSMKVIQECDSILNGQLLEHTSLMCGASGGLLGMAYLRELMLQKKMGADINLYYDQYIDDISRDLLNAVAFAIVSNDLFIPWSTFSIDDQHYHRDRGYVFEKQLDENTNGILNKRMVDYKIPEYNAEIPLMFITPSIVNDGRRMIISSQETSYMTVAPIENDKINTIHIDGVEFSDLFKGQSAEKLKFLSALRMNATFPYVLPNVHLPSSPSIEVMDAGFRDNFGIKSAIRFIHTFQEWMKENTDGVILLQVNGFNSKERVIPTEKRGLISTIFNPLGIAAQILTLQDYEHDTNLVFLYDLLGKDFFEVIQFTYHPSTQNEQASMTFHLTAKEKADILRAFELEENQKSLKVLIDRFSE